MRMKNKKQLTIVYWDDSIQYIKAKALWKRSVALFVLQALS